MKLDKNIIREATESLIKVFDTNLGCELTTPLMYPNGDSVSVIISISGELYTVHDCSAGKMYLLSNGIKINNQIKNKIYDIASLYACDFSDGRVQTTATIEQLPVAIALVANASQAIGAEAKKSDYKITLRQKVTAQMLELAGKRVRTNEEVHGKSGKAYKVSNVLLDKTESKPIAYVEAVSNEHAVAVRFMEFSDILGNHENVTCNSVYDDNQSWEPHSMNLLAEVSTPIAFSRSSQMFSQMVQ